MIRRRDFFRKKTWIITAIIFVLSVGLSAAIVFFEFSSKNGAKVSQASADDKVSGWAWNSNIGWVSFNCLGENPACSGTNYGVTVDLNTGHFSGYGWSSNVGWISFNETGAPDYGFNASCLSTGSCAGAANCTACYNWNDHKVYGWAKILTMGAGGWIKFNGSWDKGVSIDPATGEFSGWAWNANDGGSGLGWTSFNCANDNSCGASNYKVIGQINRPPRADSLTAPNWSYAEAKDNAKQANLQFSFVDPDSGSYGGKYQIIIKKSDDSLVLDTGECTGYGTPSAYCKIDNTICMKNGDTGCINAGDCVCQFQLGGELNYAAGYKWSVKVWDNYGSASALTPYSSSSDTPSQADDGAVPTFTTYKHKFPAAAPTCFPEKPSKGEKVKCTANSQRFFSDLPAAAKACDQNTCGWLWTKPSGAGIDDSATSTPTLIFNNVGRNTVILRVTDKTDTGAEPYYSEFTVTIDVNAKLPRWKEVKPE